MLLETLDIKHDDVVIYSQNLFDLEKNFKIIYKDDLKKEHRKVSYSEVCRIVNEFTPKNLIVYRLLTNIKDFEILLSKYGFFLNINGVTELIYFDPVYAVKELEDYPDAINFYDLRFRIQQVGLTTLNRKGDLPNFAEIYNIDLEATEAKFQNDQVFADAIFSVKKNEKPVEKKILQKNLDEKKIVEEKKVLQEKNIKQEKPSSKKDESIKSDKKEEVQKNVTVNHSEPISFAKSKDIEKPKTEAASEHEPKYKVKIDKQHIDGIRIIDHDISEDKDFDYKQIMKINFKGAAGINGKKLVSNLQAKGQTDSNIVPKLVKTEEREKSSFGKFLEEKQTSKKEKKTDQGTNEEKVSPLLDIFKSPSSLTNFVKERENKQVILKLDKK